MVSNIPRWPGKEENFLTEISQQAFELLGPALGRRICRLRFDALHHAETDPIAHSQGVQQQRGASNYRQSPIGSDDPILFVYSWKLNFVFAVWSPDDPPMPAPEHHN